MRDVRVDLYHDFDDEGLAPYVDTCTEPEQIKAWQDEERTARDNRIAAATAAAKAEKRASADFDYAFRHLFETSAGNLWAIRRWAAANGFDAEVAQVAELHRQLSEVIRSLNASHLEARSVQ